MATVRRSIFRGLNEDDAEVYIEPASVKTTNKVWHAPVLVFEDGTVRSGFDGSFSVPKDYVGSAKIIVVWSTPATSGDVEWDFDYRAVGGNDTESLDQTGTQESVNVLDTAPSAAHERLEASLALTSANLAVDDVVLWKLLRDKTDVGDTLADAAMVYDILFEYSDA